jgi:hypothetical protein
MSRSIVATWSVGDGIAAISTATRAAAIFIVSLFMICSKASPMWVADR